MDESLELLETVAQKMDQFKHEGERYGELAYVATAMVPRTGVPLLVALQHRNAMLDLPEMPSWFLGIGQLIEYIEVCQSGFHANTSLRPIAFLIERAHRDFWAAIELALSGLHGSTFDTMRDVMEIQYLLTDFHYNPSHVALWLQARTRDEKDFFQPVKLRNREAVRQGLRDHTQLQTNEDYKNHSQALHVNADPTGTAMKGVHPFDEGGSRLPFWEIFFHGAGIISVLMLYVDQFDKEVGARARACDLDRFFVAWEAIKVKIDEVRKKAASGSST